LSYVSQKEAEPRQTRMIEGKLGHVNGVDRRRGVGEGPVATLQMLG